MTINTISSTNNSRIMLLVDALKRQGEMEQNEARDHLVEVVCEHILDHTTPPHKLISGKDASGFGPDEWKQYAKDNGFILSGKNKHSWQCSHAILTRFIVGFSTSPGDWRASIQCAGDFRRRWRIVVGDLCANLLPVIDLCMSEDNETAIKEEYSGIVVDDNTIDEIINSMNADKDFTIMKDGVFCIKSTESEVREMITAIARYERRTKKAPRTALKDAGCNTNMAEKINSMIKFHREDPNDTGVIEHLRGFALSNITEYLHEAVNIIDMEKQEQREERSRKKADKQSNKKATPEPTPPSKKPQESNPKPAPKPAENKAQPVQVETISHADMNPSDMTEITRLMSVLQEKITSMHQHYHETVKYYEMALANQSKSDLEAQVRDLMQALHPIFNAGQGYEAVAEIMLHLGDAAKAYESFVEANPELGVATSEISS